MKSVLVSGYKQHELGIFKDNDEKIKWIKKAIKRDLIRFLDDGLSWIIFTGALGFEFWCLEVAKELQEEYDLNIATIFNFENYGENWNEANQAKLAQFKAVDFVKYCYPRYEAPRQLREYQNFLLEHTDGAYLFYDPEHETNLKYLDQSIRQLDDYELYRLDFDRLNELFYEE